MQQLYIMQILLVASMLDLSVALNEHRKRSPLELGYVSFAQVPASGKHGVVKHAVPATKSVGTLHPKDVWVPGHVSHHAYIPPHHVIVHHQQPQPLLVATHSLHFYDDGDPFRRTYGGFGVGIGVGGHGTGHGYHVLFN